MKKTKFNLRSKWSRKHARKAIPLFASFFLGQFPLPAGNIADRNHKATYTPSAEALKFVQFELEIYSLYEEMGLEKTGLNLEVFNKAMVGYLNLLHAGDITNKNILTIADFDKHSSEKRLWVLDVNARKILNQSLVTHGKNSGFEMAEKFSNVPQSEMSSLGFYVTQDTYIGKHGVSLKLNGMDEAYNKNAYDRNIVIHGAEYAGEDFVKRHGRLGRSQGCPALPMENHREIIDKVKGGSVLYLHASNADYNSQFLDTNVAMNTFFSQDVSVASI